MDHGARLIADIQLYDKYARWIPGENRRETWPDVVTRVMSFFQSALAAQGKALDDTVWTDLTTAMLQKDVLPSMRVVQMAGPPLERCHVGAYNCLAGDERFVTKEGIKTFVETVGTTQTVLCEDGQWRPAEVSQFGEAKLQAITLRPGANSRTSLRRIVKATVDHGWVTTRGHVRDLRVGDCVLATAQQTEWSAFEWVRGFLFGDGTVQDGCARARLCGKKQEFLGLFESTNARISYPSSAEGDPVVSWPKGQFDDAKVLPANPTPCWMLGYLAADGGHQELQPTLSTVRKDVVDYIQDHAAELGIVVTGLTVWTKDSNFGPRQPLYKLGIRPAASVQWRVMAIEETEDVAPVYCVTEPVTHTFTLAGGLTSMNCAYLELDGPKALGELLYILMQGTGVGYSVETRVTQQWGHISETDLGPTAPMAIEDATDEWCKAFVQTITWSMEGWQPVWDYSKIRPEGAWLHTKGGRASGPAPLQQLLETTYRIIREAAGRTLRPFEIHRMATMCGSIVQVGGVRRAAEICLFDADDAEMAACKDGEFWATYPELGMANNSMVFVGTADPVAIHELVSHLSQVGSGEPGIFRRDGRVPERRQRRDFGTNPCLHPDSLVETIHGRVRIADMTEPTMVYTMEADGSLGVRPASASWVSKRNAQTVTVTVASGHQVRCTPDHKIYVETRGWVEAQDLRIGDKVAHLVRNRRGAAYSDVKLTTEPPRQFRMEHRLVWEAVNGPIPDGWDIHHIDNNTYNNDIDNLECLSHADHAALTALEQANDHQVKGTDGKFVTHPNSRGGAKTIVPMPAHLKSNLHQYATVTKIEAGEVTDVYDVTVEGTHNFIADFVVVHNCGEIVLRSRQFCNLSIAVARPTDTQETLRTKVSLAAVLGTLQSCLTTFRYLSPEWAINSEAERLLGVDITGTLDCPLLQPSDELPTILHDLRGAALQANRDVAALLGISESKAVTCNKPSGNSSQLLATASGIHPRYADYYVRRLRIGARSPLGLHLQALGIPCFPEVGQGTLDQARVWVFELPVQSPEGSVTRHQLTARQQLDYWLTWKQSWTEHNPSCTIYVLPHEWPDIEAFLLEYWEEIGGLSFLPKDTHTYQLAPYEEITKAEYDQRSAALPADLNLGSLRESVDLTTVAQDYACVGGLCEL